MTSEEELIQTYFDAFNRHDVEAVMACFHENPVTVGADDKRYEGRDEVRRQYETEFALMPDCRCDLRLCTGSYFRGTRPRTGRVIEAVGAEVIEIVDGKIKEIRDYHRPLPAKAA